MENKDKLIIGLILVIIFLGAGLGLNTLLMQNNPSGQLNNSISNSNSTNQTNVAGETDNKAQICSYCKGTGVIKTPIYTMGPCDDCDGTGVKYWPGGCETCSICNGEGKFKVKSYKTEKCNHCGGDGYI